MSLSFNVVAATMLACILVQITQSVPQKRFLRALYGGNHGLGVAVSHGSNIETFLYPEGVAEMDKRMPLSLGKKYDRNCFFSPVQCMLSFNNQNQHDDAIWNSRGRR
uniref:COesterase domain-containing protein n=1 Tax=Steinernema glaseri TaxID=37863 RepID=A0A1I7XWJ2_9BILA